MGINNDNGISNAQYIDAIEDAQILLAHASREGLEVSEEIIDIIVKASQEKERKAETEVKFWMAFQRLSELVKPVSVNSLKAIKNLSEKDNSIISRLFKNRHPQSSATRAVRLYKILVFITILSLLFLQIYWLIGSNAVKSIKKYEKDLQALMDNKIQRGSTEQDVEGKDVKHMATAEPANIILTTDEITARIDTGIEILQSWNKVWKFATFSLFSSNQSPRGAMGAIIKNCKDFDIAGFTLEIIQNYLLPLLYGLLGALTFVLRSLVEEIKNLTFTNESRINYGMRILLGMMAGFVVTWFFSVSESADVLSLKKLSPMALSFLVGYSIELLFSGMDGLISAFTKKRFGKAIS